MGNNNVRKLAILRSLIGEFEVIAIYPQQNQNCYINGKAIIATFIRPYGLCPTTPTISKASSNASPFTPKRQAIP
ncbi:MAG: hypothetical protein IM539_16235 [Pseudanabaena sp. M046S1SP1A06QC]|nr:hypothetical protein [Pseudanabaena sp. M046S1SP1A06QC]